MKGYVKTPEKVALRMVSLLFKDSKPSNGDQILFPGVGEGPFIQAVRDYCNEQGCPYPEGFACDTHGGRLRNAREQFADLPIRFEETDFLSIDLDIGKFDYVVGNPPYVPITEISDQKKERYREEFKSATGRFDLYLLFFEQSLNLLSKGGKLVFITPEKFEYTLSAGALRQLLASYHLERLEHVRDDPFPSHITYPTISVIQNDDPNSTIVMPRAGDSRKVSLPFDGSRWSEYVRDIDPTLDSTGVTLGDITERISPGMATGADSVFFFESAELPSKLEPWSRPTISGKKLEQQPISESVESSGELLCPYTPSGDLQKESELGIFVEWLNDVHRPRLEERSCFQNGEREWYAWHENPPMDDILQQKILFRDITDEPRFWIDNGGEIVPRHSVYYLIPRDSDIIEGLQVYLNTEQVKVWLEANCDQARDGYLRLQSKVLEDLPIPTRFFHDSQAETETSKA